MDSQMSPGFCDREMCHQKWLRTAIPTKFSLLLNLLQVQAYAIILSYNLGKNVISCFTVIHSHCPFLTSAMAMC